MIDTAYITNPPPPEPASMAFRLAVGLLAIATCYFFALAMGTLS